MAERTHQWRVWMSGNMGDIEPMGAAYDAPPDHTKSPVLLKDLNGIVHSVVKNDDDVWLYCDIEVMKDWLTQDGKNVVPDDTAITCVKCLVGDHEG
jgi:hypothetical protein